jgi:hypothetical protein
VREDVGYEVLHCIIARLLGKEGPSLQLLRQLLGLVLEVPPFITSPLPSCWCKYKRDLGGPLSWTKMYLPHRFLSAFLA